MKPLQNYIEEEKEKLLKITAGINHCETEMVGGWWETSTRAEFGEMKQEELIDFLSQSLQRIAKITAEEIVPEKGNYSCYECGSEGYDTAISDLQSKIKEFGI